VPTGLTIPFVGSTFPDELAQLRQLVSEPSVSKAFLRLEDIPQHERVVLVGVGGCRSEPVRSQSSRRPKDTPIDPDGRAVGRTGQGRTSEDHRSRDLLHRGESLEQ